MSVNLNPILAWVAGVSLVAAVGIGLRRIGSSNVQCATAVICLSLILGFLIIWTSPYGRRRLMQQLWGEGPSRPLTPTTRTTPTGNRRKGSPGRAGEPAVNDQHQSVSGPSQRTTNTPPLPRERSDEQ